MKRTWSRDDQVFAIDETAADLLARCHRRVLCTGIPALDASLGGLPPGELLEVSLKWCDLETVQIWSTRGSEGRELLHHVVATCALPRAVAGVPMHGEEREVVFVDTRGLKFKFER
jgi:RecA/RadA recombinase